LDQLVPSGSPGIPWNKLARDNEALLACAKERLVSELHSRCDLLQGETLQHTTNSTENVAHVLNGLCDPVKIFIKQEPHKVKKLADGRLRLIFSISTADGLVERLLWHSATKWEIENWAEIPSKPGMGSSDEQLPILRANLEELLATTGLLLDTDVSGWDWQVKLWLKICAFYCNLIGFSIPHGSDRHRMMKNREVLAEQPVMALSSGILYAIPLGGITLSGRFITSFSNSKQRVYMSTLADTMCMAMGDDCTEAVPIHRLAEVQSLYNRLGWGGRIEYRTTTEVNDTIFCSLRFHGTGATPVNWRRTLFSLLSKKTLTIDYLEQFAYEMRHNEELPAWVLPELFGRLK